MTTTIAPATTTARLIEALLINIRNNPAGGTISLDTLKPAMPGYYAVGGYVQEFDSFGALFYSITDNPTSDQFANEFWESLTPRIMRNWDAIQEANNIGYWYTNGELFIDVVKTTPCFHDDTSSTIKHDHVRALAMTAGIANQQIAIGHVCTDGTYEEITL